MSAPQPAPPPPGTLGLEDRVVLVSGAGRGLGRSYALELARRGACVVVNDLPAGGRDGALPACTAAADVAAEIRAAGGRAVAAPGDVSERAEARAVVERGADAFGRLDGLVNNAGIMRNGAFEDMTEQMLESVLAVNLAAPFWLTQAAWPVMRRARQGRVVMVSSAGGMFSRDGLSNYAASKAGTYGLAKALAFEGSPHGIAVNVVLPKGEHMTSIDVPPPKLGARDDSAVKRRLADRRHNGAATALVSYLASPACAVTGQAFAAGYGHFGRVFVGMSDGWVAPDATVASAEDVMAHLDEIGDLDRFSVPASSYDEYDTLERLLARAGVG